MTLKSTLKSVFNILSGKKGGRAAIQGYATLLLAGLAIAAVPLIGGVTGAGVAVVETGLAVLEGSDARRNAKKYDPDKSSNQRHSQLKFY